MDQISTYQLLELFTTYAGDSGEHFMNFLAVFSAYVVAGYLVASKLDRLSLVMVTVLYVVVVMLTATGQFAMISISIDLAHEIAARDLSAAAHLTPTAAMLGGAPGEVMKVVNPLIQLIACSGSILFVYRLRRHCNPDAKGDT